MILTDTLFESIKALTLSHENLKKKCSIKNYDLVHESIVKGRNIMLVPGHYGNWEWAGGSMAVHAEMKRPSSIFISHAWGGISDEILAQLVKRLEAEDITFILDKRDLSYRQSIHDFMVQLGEADMVIIILSNKYLKSEYCMFELLEIHKNENLSERIFPIVLDEVKISSSADRLEFVKYWETQLMNLQNKVKELNSLSYIEGITDDLNLYAEIRNNIARLTGILRDINTLNITIHRESDYEDLDLQPTEQVIPFDALPNSYAPTSGKSSSAKFYSWRKIVA